MSAIIKEIIIRVLCGGLLCTIVMIICGEGSHKEPVRLSCAAFMIILIFYPYKNSIDFKSISRSDAAIRSYIASEYEKAEDEKNKLIISQIEGYAKERAEKHGIKCKIKISWSPSDEGMILTGADVTGEMDSNQKDIVIKILTDECGIAKGEIFFKE